MAAHYHAINTSLSAEDAALCVYPKRPQASEIVDVFVSLARHARATVRMIYQRDAWYEIREGGRVYDVKVMRCEEADCPKPQNSRGRG